MRVWFASESLEKLNVSKRRMKNACYYTCYASRDKQSPVFHDVCNCDR